MTNKYHFEVIGNFIVFFFNGNETNRRYYESPVDTINKSLAWY